MIKTRNKNGFSIVEVVIALSFIVVVTITAISIVLSSISTRKNAVDLSKAQDFADSVWESFKAAETHDEFISLVTFSEGVTLTESTTDERGATVYTYYSQKHNFTSEIAVSYSETVYPELSISVNDKDGESIVSFSYRKGDGI